jgi:hypothetical protein
MFSLGQTSYNFSLGKDTLFHFILFRFILFPSSAERSLECMVVRPFLASKTEKNAILSETSNPWKTHSRYSINIALL